MKAKNKATDKTKANEQLKCFIVDRPYNDIAFGQNCCRAEVRIGGSDVELIGLGFGSTYEISRTNAYVELVQRLVECGIRPKL